MFRGIAAILADPRNWLLLAAAVLSAIALYSVGVAHGLGPRWTGWFSLAALASVACDTRVRAVFTSAWLEAVARAGDRRAPPWRAALLLVAFPSLLLLLSHPPGIQTGDSRAVVMTAASLLSQGDAELSEFAELYRTRRLFPTDRKLPYFLVENSAGIFSQYPSGMLPFVLPPAAVARLLNDDLEHPVILQHVEQLAAALVSGACVTLFFLLAWHVAPPLSALVATILLATGSVMYSTVGQALWQHGGVIFWTEVLLLIEFRTWRRASWRATAAQGVALAMMLACRLSAVVVVSTFGFWVLVRSPRRAVTLAAMACLAALPWMAFHWRFYENLSGPMVVQTQGSFWSFGKTATWAGILVSPTHGLLVYQPWLFAAVASIWPRKRCTAVDRRALACDDAWRAPPGWRWWAASALLLHLIMVSGWWCWWGGLCWGSRLASEAVPLAALLLLPAFSALLESRLGRALVFALVVVSPLLHVPSVWLHQDRWYTGMDTAAAQEANAWTWHWPPFLYPLTKVDGRQ